jgi:HEAT repeat protein
VTLRLLRRPLILGCLAAAACANHAHPSVVLYETGDYAGAARVADRELATHPGDEGLWQMRVRAALALGDAPGVAKAYASYRAQLGGDDDKGLLRDLAIATLGQALASPSAKLKIAAIEAVAASEIQELAEQVAQKMSDDDDRVVATAAVAVLRGYGDAPKAASDMMKSEDPEARRIAVDGVGKKVGRLALADLEKAGADSDARVRRAAVRWLGELKDRDAVELLTERMHDPDDAVRAVAATALARIGLGNLAELGQLALRDPALPVRLAGITLIVAAHRPDQLTVLVDDPDPIVAAEAAIARGGGAGPAIERAATAPSWTIRAGAANLAVRGLGTPAALALARRLVADPAVAVRLAAARVLAHGGDRAAAAAVFAAALEDLDHRVQAAIDLAEQDDPRGMQALDRLVRDPAHGPLARAAAAAGHRAAHHVTPGLVAALADDSGAVRVEAAAALAGLSRP